jgi:drug/metabolite transporter (DMT)-like permease
VAAGNGTAGPDSPFLPRQELIPKLELEHLSDPGMKLKEDLRMAAAILGTPLSLYLLSTDLLRKPSLVAILVVSALYIFASLAMNILNKQAARAFEGTCLLVIIQMLVSIAVILCMERDKMKMEKWTDFLKWLVVPFAFAGMLGTSMFAFKEASLTTILIMRNILPILTFGFEKVLFNQPESMCWRVICSLVVTLIGSVLYGFVDISATNVGKILILVNCFFTIVDRLVQAHLLKGNKDFSISISMCMLLNNLIGIIPMFFLAVARGEVAHWGHAITSAGKNTWFLVVMSGLCGASLGYVGLRTQQLVSGTTVLVLQNFNKLLIISIGMAVFHERLTTTSLLGCGVSLLGCFAYGYLRLPSEAKAKDGPPSKEGPSKSALSVLAEANKFAAHGSAASGPQAEATQTQKSP